VGGLSEAGSSFSARLTPRGVGASMSRCLQAVISGQVLVIFSVL